MADTANFIPSSPFDAFSGGGFSGGEGAGGLMPSLPAAAAAPTVTAMPGPVGGYTYESLRGFDPTLPADPFQGAALPAPVAGGGAPYSIPAPYMPPGGGYMAPPDVTVAGAGPGTTAAGVVTAGTPYSPGGVEVDEYGQVTQGGGEGSPATLPSGARPPAVQTAQASPVEQPYDPGPGNTLTPQGAQAAAQAALSGVKPSIVDEGGPMSWLARNILEPYKKSGVPELLGIGIPAASLIRNLSLMQGGQQPLDPLQQQRLQMAQQQQNVAQQYLTGQVPASVQQNIQAQTQARVQQIRAKYAQLGMSGSTAEQQDIAAAQAQGSRDLATASTQMVNAGAAMMNLPAQQFQTLTREQLAQDAAFSDALAKFVASLSAGPAQTKTP